MTEPGQHTGMTTLVTLHLVDTADVKKKSIQVVTGSHDEFQEVIQFKTSDSTELNKVSSEEIKRARLTEVQSDMILSQSIAIVLFHTDSQPHAPDIDKYRQKLGKYPWRFHHITELNTKSQTSHRVHIRQEFHELARDLPLFSIGSVHYGYKIIRFIIFTRHHQPMVEFYSQLFDTEPERTREDFYLFRLQQKKGVEVQLALKSSTKIIPYPTDKVRLVFEIRKIPAKLNAESITQSHLCTRDPDSNLVMLQHREDHQKPATSIGTPAAVSDKEKTTLNIYQSKSMSTPDFKSTIDQGLNKLKNLEQSQHLEQQRPDVIPQDDHLIKDKHSTGPTLIKLGNRTRAKSPCPFSRKLNFTTQAVEINFDGINPFKQNAAVRKPDSIDIVATF